MRLAAPFGATSSGWGAGPALRARPARAATRPLSPRARLALSRVWRFLMGYSPAAGKDRLLAPLLRVTITLAAGPAVDSTRRVTTGRNGHAGRQRPPARQRLPAPLPSPRRPGMMDSAPVRG